MSNACRGYLIFLPASSIGTSLILSKCSVFATLFPVAHFATTQLFTPHHFATSLCDILNSSFNFASNTCACPTFSLPTRISTRLLARYLIIAILTHWYGTCQAFLAKFPKSPKRKRQHHYRHCP